MGVTDDLNLIHFQINFKKALEVILWLINKSPGLGFHAILKLLFFADKYHINKFGRPVVGDRYVAMQYGPVASVTYDILKGEMLAIEMSGEDPLPFEVRHQGSPHVYPKRLPNLDMLSESDIEALDHSFNLYGSMNFQELSRISHNDPAYKNAELRGINTTIRYEDMIELSEHRERLIMDLKETATDLVF